VNKRFKMLRVWVALWLMAGLAGAAAGDPPEAAEGGSGRLALSVMTYNLRYASATPPNAWGVRRPVLQRCIQQVAPDLVGTQEGLYGQLKELAAGLPEYAWIGLGRDGGSRGEFMAIFYRRDRFEPVEYDHFWLSDTPEVIGSSTWGNKCRRMVTWVRFRDRTSGCEFYHWNTHLDHEIENARQQGARLIRERVERLKTTLPIVMTGDFNAVAGRSAAYSILVGEGGLADTWTLARERVNESLNSFNGFREPVRGSERIDWVLARGSVTVSKAEVVEWRDNGQHASDHFPVMAWLEFGTQR